jgi:hypothetical protein
MNPHRRGSRAVRPRRDHPPPLVGGVAFIAAWSARRLEGAAGGGRVAAVGEQTAAGPCRIGAEAEPGVACAPRPLAAAPDTRRSSRPPGLALFVATAGLPRIRKESISRGHGVKACSTDMFDCCAMSGSLQPSRYGPCDFARARESRPGG